MALEIKTNLAALQANRHFSENSEQLKSSIERLSSGLRINRSADDAAGLAISESIRARIRSLDAAKRNANDAVSFLQTAEGGFNEVTNILIRLRELTTQAASDTIGNRERSYLDKEFQSLRSEAERIMATNEFNGMKIFADDNADKPLELMIGASNRGDLPNGSKPDFGDFDPDVIKVDISQIKDVKEKLNMLVKGKVSLVPSDSDGGASDLGPDGTNDLFARVDNAINAISGFRATLGSVQSRIGSVLSTIDVSSENLAATRSRITDIDYAQETANFTRAKILTQAGLSVISQANVIPEMTLNLLR